MKRLDLHTHAKLSKAFPLDRQHLGQHLLWARRIGLDGIALTEHFHALRFWEVHDTLLRWFPYHRGIYRVSKDFSVVAGAELGIREGADMILLGEVGELRRLDRAFPKRLSAGHKPGFKEFLERLDGFDLLVIGAHMFRQRKSLEKFAPADLKRLTALEVNGKDLGTEDRLVSVAGDLGLPVVGNSDAHHWLQLGVRHSLFPIHEISLAEMRRALASQATWYATASLAKLKVTTAKLLKNWIKRRRAVPAGQLSLPFAPASAA